MNKGSITIEDVAKAASVSRQTVSRVINRQPNVRESVRERVEDAIAKLGYVPNLAARRMGGARSYVILAAFDKNSVGRTGGRLPLDDMMLQGMKACTHHGYNLLFEELDTESGNPAAQMAHALTASKPDGVVLCPSLEENIDIRNILTERSIASDYLGMRSEFGRMIPGLDDGFFGEAAAEHLLARGHRQIGFMSGLHNSVRSGRRLAGYRRALLKVGSRAHGHFMSEKPLGFDQALDMARTWLVPTIRPTAIIAETQEVAYAVLRAAEALKISVPDELSLLVLDDGPSLSYFQPPVTVLHQAYAAHFATACERLIHAKENSEGSGSPHPEPRNDGLSLIERSSVSSAPRGA